MDRSSPEETPESIEDALARFQAKARKALESAPLDTPPLTPLETVEQRMRRLGIPEKFWGAKRVNVTVALPASPTKIFMTGVNGSGKSHAAAALAIEWGARWRSAFEINARVRACMQNSGETETAVFEVMAAPRFMVLDDLLAANRSDFGMAWMLALLEARDTPRQATIVTCDRNLKDIDAIDSSLASRLAAFHHVRFSGSDRRIS